MSLPAPSGESGTTADATADAGAVASAVSRMHDPHRRDQVVALLRNIGPVGYTWQELSESTGWHHGVVSSLLSSLHHAGAIKRIAERRNRCVVYVAPEHVAGRRIVLSEPRTPAFALTDADRQLIADVTELLDNDDREGGADGFHMLTSDEARGLLRLARRGER